MNDCVFLLHDTEGERFIHRCQRCGRDVRTSCPEPTRLLRTCKVNVRDDPEARRYAFWPRNFCKLKNGTMVFPWNFYWLLPADLQGIDVPYEEAPEDASAVGTRLKQMFRQFGFKPGNCNCQQLANMLDQAGLGFLQRHEGQVVDLIRSSAAQMHVPAPKAILTKLVRLAVKKEAKCLRN